MCTQSVFFCSGVEFAFDRTMYVFIPLSRNFGDTAHGRTTCKLLDIRVSSTGVRFTQVSGEHIYYPQLKAVTLSDGTEVRMDGGGSRWSETEGEYIWCSDYYWRLPVDLSQAEALRFGNALIPLK